MTKLCVWDGEEIDEEFGSLEIREFFPTGKFCLYFCSQVCYDEYRNDAKEHGGIPLYGIRVVRPVETSDKGENSE